MSTALFTHPVCALHENGPDHPESPLRLKAIWQELKKPEYTALQHHTAPEATLDQIARVHDRAYIEKILASVPSEGFAQLDPDTALSPHSGAAALRAAGAVVAAVDAVMKREATNAFCAVRPPGHHAEHAQAMGFCFFCNVAIGAAHALEQHKLKRVAIFDFDVHHGNGTQDWAEGQENILFLSLHQFPSYPGTGSVQEKGKFGNVVNVPLASESGSAEFRRAVSDMILPAIDKFKPELVMISAGFDAHRDDPLANLRLTEEDYAWVTAELCALAHRHCNGKIVSALEGGYNIPALAASVGAHVGALMKA